MTVEQTPIIWPTKMEAAQLFAAVLVLACLLIYAVVSHPDKPPPKNSSPCCACDCCPYGEAGRAR